MNKACTVLATVLLVSEGAPPAPSAQELLAEVVAAYGQHLQSIKSVECAYTFDMNGVRRECRYARSGDKLYHAGLDRGLNGFVGVAHEVAWDGRFATNRVDPRLFNRSRKRSLAKPSCRVPEDVPNLYVLNALGIEQHKDHKYILLSAREADHDGVECIELTFAAKWNDGTLITRHVRAFGCAPVSVVLRGKDAGILYELSDVRYATYHTSTGPVHYPLESRTGSWIPEANAGNTFTCSVDVDTLRLNETIPDDRFVLEPWPNQSVTDLDSRKTAARAKDRTWSPAGKVGFPFEQLAASMPEAVRPSVNSAVINPSAARERLIATQESSERAKWWLLVGAGCALLIGSILWRIRQKRIGQA